MELSYKIISPVSVTQIWAVANVLTSCGKDMYIKYGLRHWNNSIFKNILILYYTLLVKHTTLWGVYYNKNLVGSFQTKLDGQYLNFCKFAVLPDISGKGIGGKCISKMEEIARQQHLLGLSCEVFDESKHALDFYRNRGFSKEGTLNTLKYTEIKLLKRI